MDYFQCKERRLAGTSYKEVYKNAQFVFKQVKSKSKRKPYVRSAIFDKRKVFFDNFWIHLLQKREPERVRRLKCFAAAIELIISSKIQPVMKQNPDKKSETFYRFGGKIGERIFYVQLKESGKSKTLQFMSVFPGKD